MATSNARQRRLAREHQARREARRAAERARARRRRLAALGAAAGVVAVAVLAAVVVRLTSGGADPAAATADGGGSGTCTWVDSSSDAGGSSSRPPTAPDRLPGGAELGFAGGLGTVGVTLDPERAPCAVTSFRHLAGTGFFAGTRCHRLTTSETLRVLQCGDPTGTGRGGPGYSFADEGLAGATYPAGTVAMANAGADSNGSQFFLVYADSTLPASYTPFGRITSGLDVLQRIAARGVSGGGTDGAPAAAVTLASVTLRPAPAGAPASPAGPASPASPAATS